MALQGTIDSFPLTDVLRLLAASSKSGRLVVNGDRGHGQVWLAAGAVTGGETTQVLSGGDPTEVVFDLLRYATGSFIFEADAANPDPSASLPVDYVLTQSEAALAEWRELAAVVPSGNAWLVLSELLPQPEVVIDQAMWSHLVTVAPGLDVTAFGRALSLGEVATLRLVRDLIASGLVAVGERPAPLETVAAFSDADGTDQLVAEVPWDQWSAEVFEPSGAEEDPELDGPQRDLFGAFDPFASGTDPAGSAPDAVGGAVLDGGFAAAAFDGAAFADLPADGAAVPTSAAFDDSSAVDATSFDGSTFDDTAFDSAVFELATDDPSAEPTTAGDHRPAFEMGASGIDPTPVAPVLPAAPVSHTAPINHAVINPTPAAPPADFGDLVDDADPADMGDDVIRQMAMLSPKAAQAVATAMSGHGPVSSDALPDSDEERDRLLKFLGSV